MASPALLTRWYGVLLVEDGDVVDEAPFEPSAEAIAERLACIREGGILDEERGLAQEGGSLLVPDARLTDLAGAELAEDLARVDPPGDVGVDVLKQAALALAEETIEAKLGERARHLVQAVRFLDESHTIENRMSERLVSWYRLHAPAIVDAVDDPRELARLVAQRGDRAAIAEALDVEPGMGSELDPSERNALQGLATSILQQVQAREPLEGFVAELARELAPNVSQVATPAIAARLIQHAGGLEELAKLPAGTIQMLGAEGAVFRHLTEDAPPPKHGVIYRHPAVHEAHPADRGKIARALAAKLAIAARADALTGRDIASHLAAEFRARVEQIQREGRRRAMRRAGP